MNSSFTTAPSPCINRHRPPPLPFKSPLIRFGFMQDLAVLCLGGTALLLHIIRLFVVSEWMTIELLCPVSPHISPPRLVPLPSLPILLSHSYFSCMLTFRFFPNTITHLPSPSRLLHA